jgi:hypothetical protein
LIYHLENVETLYMELRETDTLFFEKSLKEYLCARAFFEISPRIPYAAAMATETEFLDGNFWSFQQYGVPSALRCD